MRWVWRYLLPITVALICLSPIGLITWASLFAERHGCRLNEGSVNPCVVNGVDYGERLYSAFVSGWYLLVTGPVALACLGLALAFALGDWLKARKNRKQ